jgi:hypothetical protein
MKASIKASIKKFRAKFIALLVLTVFIGAIYNAADRKVVDHEFKNDFSKFKKGDYIVLIDTLNEVVNSIIVYDNNPAEKSIKVEFMVERLLCSSVQVPLLNYEILDQSIWQNKLSLKLIKNISGEMKDVIQLKLKNK